MESKARKNAANAAEGSPEIGCLIVRVVENDRRGIEPLRKTNAAFETQTFTLRPCCHPRKRQVGDKVVVVVESADVAMTAREERFDDLAFGALERDMLKELPSFVARNGVTRPFHVARTIHRDIESNSCVNCVP